jgi:hypothetical protein
LSEAPSPGWYADPQGVALYRWWDGLAWTSHTADGQQSAQSSPQPGFYGATVNAAPAQTQAYAPAQGPAYPTQFGQPPRAGIKQRNDNHYAFITVGVVALYVLIAWKAHIYVLGILPVMMSVRSKQRNEPLAVLAIAAAVVAVLVAILGLTHR